MFRPPFPELDVLLESIGLAGRRITDIGAGEGAAGNISICVRWPLRLGRRFPLAEQIQLPQPAPELAGATLLVTGSGQRLRDILDAPEATVGCAVVEQGGRTAVLFTSHRRRFQKLTSEFNSHLAIHADQVRASGADFLALVHAQPLHLTYLSHLPDYQDEAHLNANLLRWQPETILNLPEGLGLVPFQVPGSPELMAASVASLRKHRLLIWSKHGVVARSAASVLQATDLVEYAEAAAHYEFLDLTTGGRAERLRVEDLLATCAAYGVKQSVF